MIGWPASVSKLLATVVGVDAVRVDVVGVERPVKRVRRDEAMDFFLLRSFVPSASSVLVVVATLQTVLVLLKEACFFGDGFGGSVFALPSVGLENLLR